jgi:multidrug efflux pump subunit AcrA (membrane-fusion protein)
MNRKYFLIVLALTALCFLLIVIFFGKKPSEEPLEKVSIERSPFPTYVKGVGVVEPKSGNIYIGIPFDRIVKHIYVSVNDKVKKGDLIIQFDTRDLVANLQVKQGEYEKALANLQKLEALPRKEDLIIAGEALKKAQIALDAAKTQYEMILNLPNPRAISKEEQDKRLYKLQIAEAEMREAQTQYEKIKAGTWEPDLKIALYQVTQAQADVEVLKTEIERTSIKSPIDGTVLQIKIHEGETPTSDISKTAIIVGNVDEYYLRVSIDQFNVSNLTPNAQAAAFRQGNRSTEFLLEFLHFEPFMMSKKYLTNSLDEKVDTQVFEILYKILTKDSGLFIGEKMDVFIDKQK